MILDNLSHAVKTQNWLAAGIEFLIVLAGVVAGFQISAWAEAQAERQRETLLLARLDADFADLSARAAESIDQCTEGQNNALEFSTLLATAPEQERETLVAALASAIGTPVPIGRSATYVELLASGEMALIRSEALRTALVDFDEQVRRHELAYESLSTLTISNAGIMFETYALVSSPSAARLDDTLTQRFQGADLAAGAQIMALVNARNCFWFESVRTRADAVRDTLGALS